MITAERASDCQDHLVYVSNGVLLGQRDAIHQSALGVRTTIAVTTRIGAILLGYARLSPLGQG